MEAISIIYQTVVTLRGIYDKVEGNKVACHHLINLCVSLEIPLRILEKNENRLIASKEPLITLSSTVQQCLQYCRKYMGKLWYVKVWRLVKVGEQDRFDSLERSLISSIDELKLGVNVDILVCLGDDLQGMKAQLDRNMSDMKNMLYEMLVQGGNLNDFQQSENPRAIIANIMTNSEMLVSLVEEAVDTEIEKIVPVRRKSNVFHGPILQINQNELVWNKDAASLLGMGGFGSVYRCEYNGRAAALKQFACLLTQTPDEKEKRRIKREALIMQLASFHPNVVGFLGADIDKGMIVMELAPFSLHDLLYKQDRQSLWNQLPAGEFSSSTMHSTRWKVAIMLDIARALSFIHFHGVLHRDIKSRNVMLVVDTLRLHSTGLPLIAKVSDFGLALAVSASSSGRSVGSQLEGSGAVGSTPYMGPELLRYEGEKPIYTSGADVYAFGVLANEMLTEQEPWKGLTIAAIIGKVAYEQTRPARFASTNEQEELLVLSMIGDYEVGCLHQDPALRPSAADLCSEGRLSGLRFAADDSTMLSQKEVIMTRIEQAILDAASTDTDSAADETSDETNVDSAAGQVPSPSVADAQLPPAPPHAHGPPNAQDDGVHNMPWLVKQCSVLSEAVYDADVLAFLGQHSSAISLAVSTDPSIYPGKILFAEATDSASGKQYLIVALRGSNITYSSSALQFYQTLPSAGDALQQFYAKTYRLLSIDFLLEIIRSNKTLVFTGHSLGGACANILTTQFLKLPHQYRSKCKCVTFGSPLFAGESMKSIEMGYPDVFHHYVIEIDPVPKLLTNLGVMRALLKEPPEHQEHTPFGAFHSLSFSKQRWQVESMSEADIQRYYNVQAYPDGAPYMISDRLFLNHGMEQYSSNLKDAGVFAALPEEHVATAGITSAAFAWPKADRMVFLKDESILELIGDSFGLVVLCTVMMSGVREKLPVSFASPHTVRVNLCPDSFLSAKEETAFYGKIETIREIGVTLYTLVGNSVTKVIAFEVTSIHKVQEALPTDMISQVLPLTHLLSRQCINQAAGAEWNLTTSLAEMTNHTHAIIYDTIPIEFAFNIMTKDYSKELDLLLLKIFLKRLAEVYFISWQELCSRYMLEVILKSIEQLQKQEEALVFKLEELFFDAFNRDDFRLYGRCFNRIGKTRCKQSGDIFYVSGSANSPADYWNLICNEGISVGVSIVSNLLEYSSLHDSPEPRAIHFNNQTFTVKVTATEAAKANTYFGSTRNNVKIHVFEITSDRAGPLQRGETQSSPTVTKVTSTFTHFTLLWEESKPPEVADWLALVDTCRKILDTTAQQQSMHVQMHGNLQKAVAFLLSCSCNQHPAVTKDTIKLIMAGFHKDLPEIKVDPTIQKYACKMFEPRRSVAEKTFCNVCLELQSRMRLMSHKNNPRKRVIDMLKDLALKMVNNRSLVDEQFLCGKTISVECELRTGGKTHFFRPVDQEGLQANSGAQLMKQADSLSSGLLFVGLMLCDMIEVSQSKMIEKPRENTAGVLFRAVLALVASAPLIALGAMRKVRHNIEGRVSNIVDLQFSYQDWWHNVYYETSSFSNYADLIDIFVKALPVPSESYTLHEKEDIISHFLPRSFEMVPALCLGDLIKKADEETLFEPGNPLTQYTTGTRTAGVIIFFLKLLYHSRQLRLLRNRFKVITVAGQKNCGKTTLLKKLLGEDIVTAATGDGEGEETTMLPTAYCYPGDLRLTLIDLPGCTDERTDKVSSMFARSSEFSIFLISPKEPPENQDSFLFRALHETIRCARGPCLICINGFDENLRRMNTLEESRDCLDKQSTAWGLGKTLALNRDRIQRKPQLICERNKPQCVVHSTAFPSSRPLSIWLTAFEPECQRDFSEKLIFSAEDVRAWIFEVLSHSTESR